jgi:hypothetical protein
VLLRRVALFGAIGIALTGACERSLLLGLGRTEPLSPTLYPEYRAEGVNSRAQARMM